MKKMLALTLALVMALGLCACGGDTTDPAPEENPAAETVEIPPMEVRSPAAMSSTQPV